MEEDLEALAVEDDDASMVLQFENAVMDTIQEDKDLATFYVSYQDARKRLLDKSRARGFWPTRNFKGGKKGKGKGENPKVWHTELPIPPAACVDRLDRKAECPSRKSSAASETNQVPTSFALILPVHRTWFRIAIVPGQTPVLLSNEFLRTIQAVIDAEASTLWSKKLGKYLETAKSPSNLMMLNINQLWPQDILAVQDNVQVQESCETHQSRTERPVPKDQPADESSVQSFATSDQDDLSLKHSISQAVKVRISASIADRCPVFDRSSHSSRRRSRRNRRRTTCETSSSCR